MTIALTRFTLGFHVLFVRLCEWETLIPKVTPFPQISHFAIRLHLLIDLSFQIKQRDYYIISFRKMQAFFEKNSKIFLRSLIFYFFT